MYDTIYALEQQMQGLVTARHAEADRRQRVRQAREAGHTPRLRHLLHFGRLPLPRPTR